MIMRIGKHVGIGEKWRVINREIERERRILFEVYKIYSFALRVASKLAHSCSPQGKAAGGVALLYWGCVVVLLFVFECVFGYSN